MEAAEELKQFECTNENKEKVLNYAESYFRSLQSGEDGSCCTFEEFLSALNKEHPEINLKCRDTFIKHFRGFEDWKQKFGIPSRSKFLTKQFKIRVC